ncbi:MAG: DUF4199 domain-containing protein [Gemmatimonadetes bacterium]|nr:DUF4199 domain-containing protein [Gemmatimonadota bacterium]
MRTIVWKFGLIAAAICSALMGITLPLFDRYGIEHGEIVGYAGMVVAFLMVFVGVKSYRDTVAGGTISFGQAFMVGGLIALIGIAGYVLTWEIIYFGFTPDFADKYAASVIERMRQAGATDAQLAATTKEMADFARNYRNPLINAAYTFLEPLPVALLYTLVSAALLRRRPASPATA